MKLSNLKISARLTLAFSALLFITATITVVGTSRLGALSKTSDQIASVEMQRALLAQSWWMRTSMNWVRASSALKTHDANYQAELDRDMSATSKLIGEDQKQLVELITDAKGKELMDTIARNRKVYVDARTALIKRQQAGEDIMARVDAELLPLAQTYLRSLEDIADHARDLLAQTQKRAHATAEQSQWALSVGATLAVLLGMVLAMAVARSIVRPMREAVGVTQRIADGDLTARIESQAQDETGELLRALGAMSDRLRTVVAEVRTGVEAVSTASQEIATGNADLSARTEQTAANLQETAASMEELTATVSQSAETATQANQLAASAAQAARTGGEVVNQVVLSMKEITASSKRINDIIGVIDGIAFQTNILALNAAVEAARAGEQGRGFAVVAGEVRNLAQRSADAAKEIKTLISTSVRNVETGSNQVTQAGHSMEEIVSSVRRVSDLIGEITAASAEQRDGIGQVNLAVTNLDQMTQQNAALVEESSAAATSLSDQARRLSQVVSVFNVGSNSVVASVVAAPAATMAPRPQTGAARVTARPSTAKVSGKAAPAKALGNAKAAGPALATASQSGDEQQWEQF
ncbi:methyl-accepting chemotaxis protein [Hylemonella gracilis]|uniref:Chemotaxis sensory transducer n=1 Tax=Hylemonella gracilis ATCC 19624 TaxID=887062 RepID=F3KRS9_9BURK|nr:methyl-accepting chemotaxis protein [Hylemonella gracilis]EGI77530.1 chemotaxis sensory transducer [Hylemonella gracilis ATCC 19624]